MITYVENRGTIVLLESNCALQMLYTHILEEVGYTVHKANDTHHCLELCRANPPDILLMDTDSPGVPAQQLVRELRAATPREWTAIVICTLYTPDASFRAPYVAAGADAFICKNFSERDELPAALEQCLALTPQCT